MNVFWQRMKIIFACLLLFVATSVYAITFPAHPVPGHFYVDDGRVLTIEQRSIINNISKSLFHDQKIPLIIVTIPSLVEEVAETITLQHYAELLFDTWRIGVGGTNYGIILLISKGDKSADIQIGDGWSAAYRTRAEQILNQVVKPSVKRGEIANAIVLGARNIDAMVRNISLEEEARYAKAGLSGTAVTGSLTGKWLWIILIIAIGAIAYSCYSQGRNGWGWWLLTAIANLLSHLLHLLTGGRFGKSGE